MALAVGLVLAVVGRHREVFLPLSVSATIRLDPLLPYPFALAAASMISPRLFTLDPRGWRERGVRLLAVLCLSACTLVLLCVSAIPHVEQSAVLVRNYLALLGLLLLLACVVDAPLAALVLGVALVLFAYMGSQQAGEPRQWALLLREPGLASAWWLAAVVFLAGLTCDVLRGRVTGGSRRASGP